MRTMILLVLVCLAAQGCQRQAAKGKQGEHIGPMTPAPKLSEEEMTRIKELAWIGDADASLARPVMGRYEHSAYWSQAGEDRAAMTSASYGLRYGAQMTEPGAAAVEQTPEGLMLRLYQGQSASPKDIKLELPLKGALDEVSVALAHDQIAVVSWAGRRPQLTVYRQADKAQVWSVPLDLALPGPTPLALAWHDSGEISVERRGVDTYERIILSGETGAVLLAEQLDPQLLKIILDPITFILAAPLVYEDVPPPNTRGVTPAQRFPRSSSGSICKQGKDKTYSVRVREQDDGMLVVAEATYDDRADRGDGPPSIDRGMCNGVRLMGSDSLTIRGRWSTWSPDKLR